MNFTNDFSLIKTVKSKEYFVGMNTGHGFVGKYGEIANEKELNRLYIIKGASGTGKSTLMRSCAEECERKGHSVTYYLCSSDPDSFDCVVIDGKVAIADGTSPHVLEMTYPGAVSEIIDVTAFWNPTSLRKNRDEIIQITEDKKRAFADGYSLLSDVSSLAVERYNSSVRAILLDKLDKYTSRFVASLGKAKGSGKRSEAIVRSVGMKGCSRLDTLEKLAERIICVNDSYASVYHFMDMLAGKLTKGGFDIVISPDPITPSLVCDIYIPQIKMLITSDECDSFEKRINMSRFIDNKCLNDTRGLMRLSIKCSEALLAEAVNMFSLGGKAHFMLEKFYSGAMDFESLGKYTEKLIKDLSELLKD